MEDMPEPPISNVFLEWLDKMFPARPPTASSTERQDLLNAGAHSVVESLRGIYEEQQKHPADVFRVPQLPGNPRSRD